MWKDELKDTILRLVSFLACTAAIVLCFFFGVKVLKDAGAKTEKLRQDIETEYQELHDDNYDEETGKKILTEEFLKKEYRLYYVGEKESSKTFVTIVTLMILGFIAVYMTSAVVTMLIDISRGRKPKIISLVVSIILIPVILVGMHYFQKLINRKLPPEPDAVAFKAYPYHFVNEKTHTETKHNDDGPDDTITTYYLVYEHEGEEKSRKVSSRIHSAYKSPGMYYLYQAEGDGRQIDFMIYPMSEYEEKK